MALNIDCRKFFRTNWKMWEFLGMVSPQKKAANAVKKKRFPLCSNHHIWNNITYVIVTFLSPFNLFLAIFNPTATKAELFESIAISTTSVGAAVKMVLFSFKMKSVREMERILQRLDARIEQPEDKLYFEQHMKSVLVFMERLYILVYAGITLCIVLASLLSEEQKLLYPGWFPFNWKQSRRHYFAALSFQICGTCLQAIQNLAIDNFSPKALCILAGHLELLEKRVERIGYDDALMLAKHETELDNCILHQMDLYKLFDTIQKIIAWPMFIQLFVSLVSLGVSLVDLVFFVNDTLYRMYYFLYFIGMTLQLLPACYFGSVFVIFSERLHYAVFSCNWTGQTRRFKRHMMLFTERSLKIKRAMAGGIFAIHLTTFFATCKGAYSMFAVVITMK